MLLASCAAGIGTFGMPAELVGANSPILFRDHFNSSASPAKWKTVNGTWAFQRRKLIGTQEGESVAGDLRSFEAILRRKHHGRSHV